MNYFSSCKFRQILTGILYCSIFLTFTICPKNFLTAESFFSPLRDFLHVSSMLISLDCRKKEISIRWVEDYFYKEAEREKERCGRWESNGRKRKQKRRKKVEKIFSSNEISDSLSECKHCELLFYCESFRLHGFIHPFLLYLLACEKIRVKSTSTINLFHVFVFLSLKSSHHIAFYLGTWACMHTFFNTHVNVIRISSLLCFILSSIHKMLIIFEFFF